MTHTSFIKRFPESNLILLPISDKCIMIMKNPDGSHLLVSHVFPDFPTDPKDHLEFVLNETRKDVSRAIGASEDHLFDERKNHERMIKFKDIPERQNTYIQLQELFADTERQRFNDVRNALADVFRQLERDLIQLCLECDVKMVELEPRRNDAQREVSFAKSVEVSEFIQNLVDNSQVTIGEVLGGAPVLVSEEATKPILH